MTIDFSNLTRRLIPHFLRKPKTLAFLRAMVAPLQTVNASFLEFEELIRFRLAHNSQIIYLEHYLNTVFPNPFAYPSNIHIIDGANVVFFYLWNDAEEQPDNVFFNASEGQQPTYFTNATEQTSGAFSFIVRVPTAVQSLPDWNGILFNEFILKKHVNFYKLAGKNYQIQYF